jgi:hypothetical protein
MVIDEPEGLPVGILLTETGQNGIAVAHQNNRRSLLDPEDYFVELTPGDHHTGRQGRCRLENKPVGLKIAGPLPEEIEEYLESVQEIGCEEFLPYHRVELVETHGKRSGVIFATLKDPVGDPDQLGIGERLVIGHSRTLGISGQKDIFSGPFKKDIFRLPWNEYR